MEVWEELQEAYEAGFDAKREVFGKDVCDLIGPTFVDGGAEGDSVTLNPVETNVECYVYELSSSQAQSVIGGETYISSHGIDIKRTEARLGITPRYQVKVHAREGQPERVFEKPILPTETFVPIITLKASLVRQGYR